MTTSRGRSLADGEENARKKVTRFGGTSTFVRAYVGLLRNTHTHTMCASIVADKIQCKQREKERERLFCTGASGKTARGAREAPVTRAVCRTRTSDGERSLSSLPAGLVRDVADSRDRLSLAPSSHHVPAFKERTKCDGRGENGSFEARRLERENSLRRLSPV